VNWVLPRSVGTGIGVFITRPGHSGRSLHLGRIGNMVIRIEGMARIRVLVVATRLVILEGMVQPEPMPYFMKCRVSLVHPFMRGPRECEIRNHGAVAQSAVANGNVLPRFILRVTSVSAEIRVVGYMAEVDVQIPVIAHVQRLFHRPEILRVIADLRAAPVFVDDPPVVCGRVVEGDPKLFLVYFFEEVDLCVHFGCLYPVRFLPRIYLGR